jgi:hypothetical protein
MELMFYSRSMLSGGTVCACLVCIISKTFVCSHFSTVMQPPWLWLFFGLPTLKKQANNAVIITFVFIKSFFLYALALFYKHNL